MALEKQGYAVTLVNNGESMVQLLKERPSSFDLFCIELMLPKRDGVELLHAIRSASETANVPVVILTVTSNEMSSYEQWKQRDMPYDWMDAYTVMVVEQDIHPVRLRLPAIIAAIEAVSKLESPV